jgi:hypothetical protein
LFTLLDCCFDPDDFFALFACVQHAYGTRVYSGVTCNGAMNCVCDTCVLRQCTACAWFMSMMTAIFPPFTM